MPYPRRRLLARSEENLKYSETIQINESDWGEDEDDDWVPDDNAPDYLKGPKTIYIPYVTLSSCDNSSDSDEAYNPPPESHRKLTYEELGSDYWQVRKIMKYIKAGDEATTRVGLACLRGFHVLDPECITAIEDSAGYDIFVNLLGVDHTPCKKGALSILRSLSKRPTSAKYLVDLGIMQELTITLKNAEPDIRSESIHIITNLAKRVKRVRTQIRKYGITSLLMNVMEEEQVVVPDSGLQKSFSHVNFQETSSSVGGLLLEKPVYGKAISEQAFKTLSLLARSPAIRDELYEMGFLKILLPILKSPTTSLLLETINVAMLCASQRKFRVSFECHNVLEHFTIYWKPKSSRGSAVRLAFKMSVGQGGRAQIIRYGILDKLIASIRQHLGYDDVTYLKYIVGCVYRTCANENGRDIVNQSKLIPLIISNLNGASDSILAYLTGILSILTSYSENWHTVISCGGVPIILDIISNRFDARIKSNAVKCFADLSLYPDTRNHHDARETLCVVWSLLTNSSPRVRIMALECLFPLMINMENSAEYVRDLSRALEVIYEQLLSDHPGVVGAACKTLAVVVEDQVNLSILVEMGIMDKINELINSEQEEIKRTIGLLVGSISQDKKNGFQIGKKGSLTKLAFNLISDDMEVVKSSAHALWKLSLDPINCISLFNSGVVPLLKKCLESRDNSLQEVCGGCLYNIRSLALTAEKKKLYKGEENREDEGKVPLKQQKYIDPQISYAVRLYFDDDIEL